MTTGANARDRSTGRRRIATTIASCAVVLSASWAHGASEVSYRDGKLWLAVEETPAETVFAAVSKRTGMTIVAPRGLGQTLINVTAAGVPLQAAIERMLRPVGYSNYILVYESDGRAGRLVILDRDREPPRTASPISPVSGEPMPSARSVTTAAWRSLAERTLAAPHEFRNMPAPVGATATPASSSAPSRAAPQAPRPLRQQIGAWKTLNAAERREVREHIRRLPFEERVEMTIRLRQHALGLSLDE